MRINDQTTNAKYFAYDGCHKIYLLEDAEDMNDAIENDYNIYSIDLLQDCYDNSCSLRFISNWKLTIQFVSQFDERGLIIE